VQNDMMSLRGHWAEYGQVLEKEMVKRRHLRSDRKTYIEGACWSDAVWQTVRCRPIRPAATGKARSPTADSRLPPTISDEDEVERSLWRVSTSTTWRATTVQTREDCTRGPVCMATSNTTHSRNRCDCF